MANSSARSIMIMALLLLLCFLFFASVTLARATAQGFGDVDQNCSTDADCGDHYKCVNGQCIHCHMQGEPCTYDYHCCTGLVCDLNETSPHYDQCVKGPIASVTLARATAQGFGDVDQNCLTDADCGDHYKCVNGQCVHCHMRGEPCDWDDQCCTGLVCDLDEESTHYHQCVKGSGLGAFLKSHLEMPIL